jgi:hypothetical protein
MHNNCIQSNRDLSTESTKSLYGTSDFNRHSGLMCRCCYNPAVQPSYSQEHPSGHTNSHRIDEGKKETMSYNSDPKKTAESVTIEHTLSCLTFPAPVDSIEATAKNLLFYFLASGSEHEDG